MQHADRGAANHAIPTLILLHTLTTIRPNLKSFKTPKQPRINVTIVMAEATARQMAGMKV